MGQVRLEEVQQYDWCDKGGRVGHSLIQAPLES